MKTNTRFSQSQGISFHPYKKGGLSFGVCRPIHLDCAVSIVPYAALNWLLHVSSSEINSVQQDLALRAAAVAVAAAVSAVVAVAVAAWYE